MDDCTETLEDCEIPAAEKTGIYSVPGFVNDLIGYTLSTAPYPNRPLAFCGAMSLLSVLVARKVRGPTGLMTNLMMLGLANSGSGKDHPRQINSRILAQVQLDDRLSGRIASGQGLEEVVYEQPSHLFQVDEFDSTLIAINKPGDANGAEIAARLMELYSAAQSVYKLRVKVLKPGELRRSIEHPHVSVFATCVPATFYSNLTPKLLSNGLVARLLVVESGERGRGQNVRRSPIPDSIINAAEFWRDIPDNCEPAEIVYDPLAESIFRDALRRSEDEYDQCQRQSDNAGCAVWSRVCEQAHKLAVLYACSADRISPEVGQDAAEWATGFAEQHARWLLTRITERAGEESRFEAVANRILLRLRNKGGRILRSEALKASKVDKLEYERIISTLVLRNEVRSESEGKATYLCLVA